MVCLVLKRLVLFNSVGMTSFDLCWGFVLDFLDLLFGYWFCGWCLC